MMTIDELIEAARRNPDAYHSGVNLHEVLGIDEPEIGRVAAFTITDDGVYWREACDDWFSVALTQADINRIIDLFTAMRPYAPEEIPGDGP